MGKLKNKGPRLGYTSPAIDATAVTRCWKDVKVVDLREGDIVAGKGVVVDPQVSLTCKDEIVIAIGLPDTKDYIFNPEDIVKAFVPKVGN